MSALPKLGDSIRNLESLKLFSAFVNNLIFYLWLPDFVLKHNDEF